MSASLLTRLAHAANPYSSDRQAWRDHDIEAAVVAHLRNMLNTRQGSCLTCPDYGIATVSEVTHDFPEALGIMQRSIKSTIQAYEPRMKNVQVRHVKREEGNRLMLEFEITGQLQLPDGRKQPVRMTTSMDEIGNLKIE